MVPSASCLDSWFPPDLMPREAARVGGRRSCDPRVAIPLFGQGKEVQGTSAVPCVPAVVKMTRMRDWWDGCPADLAQAWVGLQVLRRSERRGTPLSEGLQSTTGPTSPHCDHHFFTSNPYSDETIHPMR
jgi:hypothetical protein